MNIAALTIAFREVKTIGAIVKNSRDYVDQHLVLISEKSWVGQEEPDDGTAKAAEQEGAETITGIWETQHNQINFGLELLKSYDWVLIQDADELYTREDFKRMKEFLETADCDAYMPEEVRTYWKTTDYVCQYHEGGFTVLVRPTVKFIRLRGHNAQNIGLAPITMHHLSYVRTNKELNTKLNCTALERVGGVDVATPEQIKEEREKLAQWKREKWDKWSEEVTNLHPINPEEYPKAAYDPLPLELKELL